MKGSITRVIALLLVMAMIFAMTACSGNGDVKNPQNNAVQSNSSDNQSDQAPVQDQKDEVIIGFNEVPSNYDPLNGFYNGVQIL